MTSSAPRGEEIGPNIRRRRQSLSLSLEALAKRSGVSATMLSEVERSLKNPTIKLAYQIAHALNCTLTELLGERPAPRLSITRARDLKAVIDPTSGVERMGHPSELLSRNLEVTSYTIPPGSSKGEMAANRPGVMEQILVLAGHLTIVLSGEHHRLSPGDSVTYGVQNTDYVNESKTDPCFFLLLSDSSRAN